MNVSKLHHIQKHILKELSFKEWARFRDLKPPRVDSNLYNYHLKLLIKNGLVEKDNDKGWILLTVFILRNSDIHRGRSWRSKAKEHKK
ncbi:MAG: hypothetical protein MUF85_03295 [Patescibacteria group bacterium]|nr:hypothetical protein [Patescibacteria group bacterium]